jgi:two-component system sensor histidine kinase YesM
MGDIENISTITQGLSNLYRTAFNKGMDYIEVEKCIKSLEYYLFIQKFRYGDKLKYSIAIDENVKGFLILNLILQPIVENTIVHGLKGKNSDIEVNISACLKDNAICFTVMDNGIGMTEENLEILKFMINHESEEYDSGLRNVHRRIKLYYGEQYGITIKSKYKEGTIVEILVPVFEYAGS